MFVSVPGKILLSGGYSILYDDAIGFSMTVDSRYYMTTEKPIKPFRFIIRNPQYPDSDIDHDILSKESCENRIVDGVIRVISAYLQSSGSQFNGITVTVVHDEQFISGINRSLDTIEVNGKHFCRFTKLIASIHKTGLGGSSALTVGLMALCLKLYSVNFNRELLYILSLIANFYAQNKIGSGYDICSAIYGTQIVTKLNSSFFQKILDLFENKSIKELHETIKVWFGSKPVIPFELQSSNLHIYQIEFAIGFDSKISSKGIIEYFKSNPTDHSAFLKITNSVTECLLHYFKGEIDETELRMNNVVYRKRIRQLTTLAGIAVEPVEYSFIMDYLLSKLKDEIVYIICPGAGGYDSFVVITKTSIKDTVVDILKNVRLIDESQIASVSEFANKLFDMEIVYNKQAIDLDFYQKFNIDDLLLAKSNGILFQTNN